MISFANSPLAVDNEYKQLRESIKNDAKEMEQAPEGSLDRKWTRISVRGILNHALMLRLIGAVPEPCPEEKQEMEACLETFRVHLRDVLDTAEYLGVVQDVRGLIGG